MFYDREYVRCHLSELDISFLKTLFDLSSTAEEEGFLKLLGDEQQVDFLLDDPRVFKALRESTGITSVSFEFYFYICLRHALVERGYQESDLPCFLAKILTDDDLYHTSGNNPVARIEYGVDLAELLQSVDSTHQYFDLLTAAGNRFLFLTGLRKQFLRKRKDRTGAPGVRYYEQIGQHSYQVASKHPLAEQKQLRQVLSDVSNNFHDIRCILNELTENEWFCGV